MSPNFLPDSFVIAVRHHWQKFAVDDVILVDHAIYGKMIKRIASVNHQGNNSTFILIGDNPHSVSSEQMGIIKQSQIIGSVIWQIKA